MNKIFLAVFFSILVAGSTSATAWLLDPAIEKIFIEKILRTRNLNKIIAITSISADRIDYNKKVDDRARTDQACHSNVTENKLKMPSI